MIAVAAAFVCPERSAPAALIDGEIASPPATERRSGTVVVSVRLAPDGSIRGTSIERSSGSRALDEAARAGAEASTFTPQCKDGRAVASRYRYVTTFGNSRRAQ